MRNLVHTQLVAALDALRADGWALPAASDVALTRPNNETHGDLATNVAMVLAKPAGRKPRELAEALVAKLSADIAAGRGAIASAEIAGPGFLNLRARDEAFHAVIDQVFTEGKAFGSAKAPQPGKILVEYLSANPTGPLHIAHARGAIVGDALVSVLRAAGYDVATEYYVNDAGQKVINLAWTVRMLAHGQPLWLEAYKGDYVRTLAEQIQREQPALVAEPQPVREATADEQKAALRDVKDPTPAQLAAAAIKPLPHALDRALAEACVALQLASIRATITRLGIGFDQFFSEQSFVASGEVPALLADWTANGLAVEHDGALFFQISRTSEVDKDRVLRKSSGDFTYFATDVAYHRNKLSRGFTHLIDVFGADHHGYLPRMKAALEALGLPKSAFEVMLMQMVSLVREGQPYKMSKTSGTFITIDEIVDEIDAGAGHAGAGRDALRYFLLARSHDSPMEIDVDLAKKQSVDNPVFYAQMSHARMNQILERARTAPEFDEARANGLLFVPEAYDARLASKLVLDDEKALLALCDEYPVTVREAAQHRAPHRVLFHVERIAHAFASYYTRLQKVHHDAILPQRAHRDSGADWMARWDWDKTRARLMWVGALKRVYANALGLIGVDAPDRMERLAAVVSDDDATVAGDG